MRPSRVRAFSWAIASLAVGCSASDRPAQEPPDAAEPVAKPAASAQIAPAASATSDAADPAASSAAPAAALLPALPDDVDVRVVGALPEKLVLDGKLEDWGDVCSNGEEPAASNKDKRATGPKRGPAPTCAVLAFASDRVVIAGKLGGDGADGFWLGLTMPLDVEFPGPAVVQDGRAVELPCSRPIPKHASVCAKHNKFVGKAFESTGRFYRITPAGISSHALAGGLPAKAGGAVAGAKVHKGADGTFEITMPLTALPRAGAAPLQKVYLTKGVGELPTAQRDWSETPVRGSARFEPMPDLRADVLSAVRGEGQGLALYQPGTDEVEVFSAARTGAVREVSGKVRKLFTKKASTDNYEVGVAPGVPFDVPAVRKKDGTTAVVRLDTFRLVDVGSVGGEPRAFLMVRGCDVMSPCGATITVARVLADGKTEAVDARFPDDADVSSVDTATPYVEGGGSVFGVRGSKTTDAGRKPYDLRFTWDAAKGAYLGAQTGAR